MYVARLLIDMFHPREAQPPQYVHNRGRTSTATTDHEAQRSSNGHKNALGLELCADFHEHPLTQTFTPCE